VIINILDGMPCNIPKGVWNIAQLDNKELWFQSNKIQLGKNEGAMSIFDGHGALVPWWAVPICSNPKKTANSPSSKNFQLPLLQFPVGQVRRSLLSWFITPITMVYR